MAAIRHIDLIEVRPPSAEAPQRDFDYNRVDFLFPDFTRDKIRYDAAQAYWEVVFQRAQAAVPMFEDTIKDWKWHWRYNPMRNGDAIFSTICRLRSLAICINQRSPTPEQANEFAWRIEPCKWGRRAVIQELIITCTPSRLTMKRVFPLLISWLRGDTLPQEFEARYDV